MRLIDADAIARRLYKEHHVDKPRGKCDERQNRVLGIVISALKNPQITPTIDAVEVVRRKDCKHRKDPFVCPMCGELASPEGEDWGVHDWVEDDGFCHKGERRDSDG